MRQRTRFLRTLASGLAAAGMATIGVTAVAAPQSGASGVTKTQITYAESPGAAPNYIFPFMTLGKFSTANISAFQYYMYRPLYWVGKGTTPDVTFTKSLAKPPVSSDGNKTYTIELKTYNWSNGTKVTSTSVLFWMNIWHQKPTGYAGWFSGGLSFPTSIKAFKITSPTKFTISLKQAENPHWFLYNQLGTITPLPLAWTTTSTSGAAGSGHCATAAFTTTGKGGTNYANCKAVYDFLSEQSGYNPTAPTATINALPTYATSALWKVVDGPWVLHSFGATADAVFVPNPSYSGKNKPKVKEFIEKPFTTAAAEFNALVAGTIDWGYLTSTNRTSPGTAPSKPTQTVKLGKNNPRLASSYKLQTLYRWGMNYFPENFFSTGDGGQAGPIFKQLYVRQAIQELVTQPLYINRLFKGYGVPSYGPVPVWPHNTFASKYEEKNPYPYNPAKAKALLKSHGWKVVANGTDTCAKPGSGAGHCGAGIKKGAKMSFTLQYTSGTKTETHLMNAEKAAWGAAGIHMNLSSATFDAVIGAAVPCPKGCSWQMENWGGGWIYAPDFYPSGTELYVKTAGSNSGDFITAHLTKLIASTETGNATLTKYENYVAKVLPVIFQPEVVTVLEVRKGLTIGKQNPIDDNTPATAHWTK